MSCFDIKIIILNNDVKLCVLTSFALETQSLILLLHSLNEAYLETCQLPNMKHFAKTINGLKLQKLHLRCLAGFLMRL